MPRIRRPIDPDGAAVSVAVDFGPSDSAELTAQRLHAPPAFQTMGLIDTGASQTFIHPMVVSYLGLIARGYDRVVTAGLEGPMIARPVLYQADITMGGHPTPRFLVEVAVMSPATQGVLVIIGPDILKACKLLYDGPRNSITLRF